MSGGAFRQQDGMVSHFEVIVEDISERRSLEEQFRQAQKMEAVGLLAGGISHDFNNLLSVILGNADLLLETTPTGVQQHYAEEIKKATRRAAELTRQLLAFSRKQVLRPAILDLNAVVREVGKILQRLIGEDVRVVTDLETRLDSIRADRGQIEQILMNLATNARDAMPNGGTFTIRTRNAELGPDDVARHPYVRPGRYVRLSVSDTGVGMTDAYCTVLLSRSSPPRHRDAARGWGWPRSMESLSRVAAISGFRARQEPAPPSTSTCRAWMKKLRRWSPAWKSEASIREPQRRSSCWKTKNLCGW